MNKPIKIGLSIVGVLLFLLITAAVILVATVDPNEYKAEIAQVVKDQTGRELTFQGDIGFTFFPWLGLEVGPVSLGNSQGFAPAEMLSINKASASIMIMPLFSGEITLGQVELDGFTLNLAVNKQGVTNWADLTHNESTPAATEPTPEAAATDENEGTGVSLQKLSVQGVTITNATVLYDDQASGKTLSLTNLDLITGEVGNGIATPVDLTFDLKLDDPKIETRPQFSAVVLLDHGAGTIRLDEIIMDALGLHLNGNAFVTTSQQNISYTATLNLTETNLKAVLQSLGTTLETTDPSALTKVSAALKLLGSTDSASLESLAIKLDDTTVTLDGSVRNFAHPALEVNVDIDAIDVDRYLPPAAEQSEESSMQTKQTETPSPAVEPDLSALRSLNLTSKITIGKIKAMNLTVTDILCETTASNGVVTSNPISAKLYDGSLKASSILNANPRLASWKEQATLTDVQAGPLLKDMTGTDPLLGTTVVKYDLVGSGLTPDTIKKSLGGTASFAFTNGAINGINIAKMIRNAFNVLKGKTTSDDQSEKTDFAELLGSANIRQGHVTNNDLLMKSPLLRVTGKGWADLPDNTVDYLSTVTVVGTLKGQDGASIEELTGLPLPISIKGSLDAPQIGLDTKALAEALFKGTFKKGTKGLEETLRNSILGGSKNTDTETPKTPGDFIKGLF
ncbi:AsmA family protein [Pseudodesulfovibrio piezophilus]|uniref:Putative AsmA family protein n=1 Tax=Pseudodesulfovibrio piezophilus (strain DSM 21447 / JCM 15486 / C1TLV30) TaxID=1322246 RepID=M1WXP8_PSEP2|nr:AsmA family protein [Pseudodesulfovibrio piezophilus]CCH49838.1 putative AsmA family protein [Pseudodesulfovibrio piezophilus C1TLV30]